MALDGGRRGQMQDTPLAVAARLSDADLLRRVVVLAGLERETTVELVAHLAELDARRLYRGEGFGSLFSYCTGALRLAEHAAYNRIEAARASRRVPAILDLLADGTLNLSTVRLLAPHLRPDNVESLDEGFLTQVLLYHVVNGRRDSNDVLASDQLRTLQRGFLQQASGVLTDNLGRTANIGAGVGAVDVSASNGIIHAIDAVVLPFAP